MRIVLQKFPLDRSGLQFPRYCLALVSFAGCSQAIAVDPSLSVTPTDEGTTDAAAGDDDDAVAEPQNDPPIADAGDDLTGFVAEEIELDGTASYDPDGDAIQFDWAFVAVPAGSAAIVINESRPSASFYADRVGVYRLELAVSDDLSAAADEVEVVVSAPNEGPVANAGPDQTVDVGEQVVLNGSSSYDPDADPLTFAWTMVTVPGGSSAAIGQPNTALPQFTADVAGVYVIDLVVDDGADASLADQVRVTAQSDTDSGCLSCSAAEDELRRRARTGHLATAALVGLLPVGLFVWRRRR
ncbi:MAG: PKD domain-containing protein [Myxococcota bacterium]